MISSKDLLVITGLSRATLNNYIRDGLLPKPVVRTGEEATQGAARLGFFPDDVVERVSEIRRLRKEGVSMADMPNSLTPLTSSEMVEWATAPKRERMYEPCSGHLARAKRRPTGKSVGELPRLTIESHSAPAYFVNNRLELIWWNESAERELLGSGEEIPGELEHRSLFAFLAPTAKQRYDEVSFDDLMYLHIVAARRLLLEDQLVNCFSKVDSKLRQYLESLSAEVECLHEGQVTHFPLDLRSAESGEIYSDLYVSYFREGILFTLESASKHDTGIQTLLSQRCALISQLMRNRKPHVTPLVVMVADLQNSVNICSELPAEEYFELINEVWQQAEPIFRQYRGSHGKHAGDGMVYYFFPQPDEDYKLNALRCSLELRQMMQRLTQKWQRRKGWFNDLYLNIGLHEGREWFGAYHAGSHVEFTVLGDTVNYAARLSDFATNGSIYATKSLINQIPSAERKQIHYGVYRSNERTEKQLVVNSYASIHNLAPELCAMNSKYRDIEMLPITEVLDVAGSASGTSTEK